jgi:uncharacterized membrane protein YidH (DUF202 family)
MKKYYYTIFMVVIGLIPRITFAQPVTFRDAVRNTTVIATESLIPLLFAAALAYFIWGVANFIRSADNPDDREKGKQQILWGIIALTVMVGYFALTSIFTSSLFGSNAALPQLFNNQ